jgi:uncharacterized protein
MLTIRVDADACPAAARSQIERLARQYGSGLVLYMDDSHDLHPTYGQICQVGQGRDAVDFMLANQTAAGDIVITQDYGLAALVLARRARAIHPTGMVYTENNIDRLLLERHLAAKARQAGERNHAHNSWFSKSQGLTTQIQRWLEESQLAEPPVEQ